MLSCKKEEQPKPATPKVCDCQLQTWIKGRLEPATAWRWTGATEFYSRNCADDAKIVSGYSGNGFNIEFRVKCN